MNPPAAIDALFNRIARRDAVPAGPVVDINISSSELQVERDFLRKTSFRFFQLPPQAQNFPARRITGGRARAV